jgi:hypothetical protein
VAVAGVRVKGLRELRRDLKASRAALPRQLTVALRKVGIPVAAEAASYAPVGRRKADTHKGMLRGGYRVSVRAARGAIVNRAPFAAGAEWGMRGKWKGFRRYPAPAPGGRGRFAWRAVWEEREAITNGIADALKDVLTAQGWFHKAA